MAAPTRKPKVNPMQSPTPMAKPTKFGNHTPTSTKAPGMASGRPAKASDMGDLTGPHRKGPSVAPTGLPAHPGEEPLQPMHTSRHH